MPVRIETVADRSSFKEFLELPWKLYSDYPKWIPPLRLEMKKRLDLKKNSFFRKGQGALFIARRGGEVVGRISVSIDSANHKKEEGREGNFGSYECIDDIDVAGALVNTGIDWLRRNNVSKVLGPIHFRLEDPYPGFLVEGHQYSPYFMMTYSLPYYDRHMKQLGFEKAMDLFSYEVSKDTPLPKEMLDRAAEAEKIPNLKMRTINMKDLRKEAKLIGDIFNEALSKNWGHVPFSDRHIKQMASDLKMLADPRIILIAELNGEPVGAVINLPNYNDLIGDLDGKLFPKGLYRILLKKKKIQSLRGYAMAVRNKMRGTGLGCLMIRESFASAIKVGYNRGEITWILGNNTSMNRLAEFMGGNRNKTYRLYQKEI